METYARSIKICAWCKTKGYYAVKKGGRYLWVFAAISIVTLVPLIFEVEREVQTLELEELQVSERARARGREPTERATASRASIAVREREYT